MVQWIVAPLAVLAALAALLWLGHLLVCRLRHDLRNSAGGGSAYNPLHEIVQPQVRHATQVKEQRRQEDEQGGPGGQPTKSADYGRQ